jgi:ABC-type uncharacterized transport system involved in gliding motility auxiliary subunit
MKKHNKNLKTHKYILSFLSILAVFIILININFYIDSYMNAGIDVTTNKLYTLSNGTINILKDLKQPVTIRFYRTYNKNRMPIQLRTYASRIKSLLYEYVKVSNGKLILEVYDPEPDSDAEESAIIDNIQPKTLPSGEKCYFGLNISYLDNSSTIAFLSPANEKTVEYDITRSIFDITHRIKPKIGILSSLPVMGGVTGFIPSKYNKKPPWIFVQELKKVFDLTKVGYDTGTISSDLRLLIIVHPTNLSLKTQFAIDQYLLQGGNLLIFTDPYCFAESNIAKQNILAKPEPPGASNIPKLFAAWGVKFLSPEQVVISPDNAYNPTNNPLGKEHPAILNFTEKSFNNNNIVMSGLNKINMVFAGSFILNAKPNIQKTILLNTSKYSEIYNNFSFYTPSEDIMMNFKSINKQQNLIVQLTGKFKTAFPDGNPTAKQAKFPNTPPLKTLTASAKPGAIILAGDVDMLFNPFIVAKQQIYDKTIIAPINNNLDFVLNAVDQLSGDTNIMDIRTRAKTEYQFKKFEDIINSTKEKYHKKTSALQEQLKRTESYIQTLELESNKETVNLNKLNAIQKFKKEAKKTRKELKELRIQLRENVVSIKVWLKLLNIALIPLLLSILGIVIGIKRKMRHTKQLHLTKTN